jgi:hypothetical protein
MAKALKIVFVEVIGKLLFLYGLLGWTYGVLVQLIHPNWLTSGLSHITPWIRVDTFTVISFIVSSGGFFIWMLARERARE